MLFHKSTHLLIGFTEFQIEGLHLLSLVSLKTALAGNEASHIRVIVKEVLKLDKNVHEIVVPMSQYLPTCQGLYLFNLVEFPSQSIEAKMLLVNVSMLGNKPLEFWQLLQ